MTNDPTIVVGVLARILERLSIPYVVGGAMASTLHGEPRTTLDVDVALQLEPSKALDLVRALEADFFVQSRGIVEAAELRSQCNVVHRDTFVKVDLYVRPPTGIYVSEIERAVTVSLGEGQAVRVASAEDTVLQKLAWYRAGDEVSERQWRDVLGILRQGRARLDREYLDWWARELGLLELLERALRTAGSAE